jgi:predicted SAM-dependent methyltransferase
MVHDNDAVLQNYMETNAIYKLHLGSGSNTKEGWLNTDISRHRENIYLMDITKEFPLPPDIFDCAYSEHSIEHFSFEAGLSMLKETFRVLRPMGVIRVVTPSIGFLMNLFSHDRTSLEDNYIRYFVGLCKPQFPKPLPGFVFNTFVRAWGHEFIYDRETLRLALELAGFINIKECDILRSEHNFFKNLENVKRMPDGYLDLESMILEGTKPRDLA